MTNIQNEQPLTKVRRLKRTVAQAVTVVGAGLMLLGLPGLTNAATTREIRNVATNRCLDSNVEGKVYTLPCNGGNFQRWRRLNNGGWQNVATNRCLETNIERQVYTHRCIIISPASIAYSQKWFVAYVRGVDPGVHLLNEASRLSLDSNFEGRVYTHDYNNGKFQQWLGLI